MIASLIFQAVSCKDGAMNDIFEYFRKRAASTILVSYTVFWAIFHWQGIYVTIFIDQDIIYKQHGLLKNEYVNKYFFGFDWLNVFTMHNLGILLGWVIPAGFAYFYVWWLPKFVINPAYKKEVNYKEQRSLEKIKSEKRIQDEERKLIEKQTATEEAKIELANKKAEVSESNPVIGWQEEYREFILNEDAVSSFDELLEIVYSSRSFDINGDIDKIRPESLLLVDIWGLTKIVNSNRINLTDKGKYFARLYKASQGKGVKK